MNAKTYFTEISSPVGTLLVRGTERALTGVFMEAHRGDQSLTRGAVRDEAPLRGACIELEEYFAGGRRVFTVAVEAEGTDFQQCVWRALCAIPYGKTISYGELARRIGNPDAARAVGLANGRNPVSIIVPCHRVIGANGTLTGYGGGLERKRLLLELEGAAVKQAALALS